MTDSVTAQAERQKVHQSKRGVKKGMGEVLRCKSSRQNW